MTSGAFNTETVQMQQAAGKVDEVNSQVRALLSSLQGQVEAVAAAWKGNAATTFSQIMARYADDSNKLSQALEGIAEQIRGSGTAYSASDQSGTDAVRAAGSSLNL